MLFEFEIDFSCDQGGRRGEGTLWQLARGADHCYLHQRGWNAHFEEETLRQAEDCKTVVVYIKAVGMDVMWRERTS